jgi:hypothetical protein
MIALDPGKASHGHALRTLLRTFGLDLFSNGQAAMPAAARVGTAFSRGSNCEPRRSVPVARPTVARWSAMSAPQTSIASPPRRRHRKKAAMFAARYYSPLY